MRSASYYADRAVEALDVNRRRCEQPEYAGSTTRANTLAEAQVWATLADAAASEALVEVLGLGG